MNKTVSEDEAIAPGAGLALPPSPAPIFLVAVGYMDPGTGPQDLAGGAQFYCTLLSVEIISRPMAIFLTN
jgi:hypothetical protein